MSLSHGFQEGVKHIVQLRSDPIVKVLLVSDGNVTRGSTLGQKNLHKRHAMFARRVMTQLHHVSQLSNVFAFAAHLQQFGQEMMEQIPLSLCGLYFCLFSNCPRISTRFSNMNPRDRRVATSSHSQ